MLRVPKWDEVIREWRKLHSEEMHGLYPPKVNRIIKSRKAEWAGHA